MFRSCICLIIFFSILSCSGSVLVKGREYPDGQSLIQYDIDSIPDVHAEIKKTDKDRTRQDVENKTFLFSENKDINQENQATLDAGQGQKVDSSEPANLPIRFSGKKLLREVRYIKELEAKDIFVQLTGNAVVRRGSAVFSGYKLQILGQNTEYILSPGQTVIREPKENVVLRAGFCKYVKSRDVALARKEPVLTHYKKGHEKYLKIESHEMERYFQKRVSISWGNVKFEDLSYRGSADKAEYFEASQLLYLYGNPIIYNRENIFIADRIVINRKLKQVKMIGNVELDLLLEDSPEQTGRAIFTGDQAFFEEKNLVTGEQQIQLLGTEEQAAQMFRQDSAVEANQFFVYGDQQDKTVARFGVIAESYENRTQIFTEKLTLSQSEERFIAETAQSKESSTERPNVLFFDEERNPESILIADEIVRVEQKDVLQARGNVSAIIFEKKADGLKMGARLQSSLADYNEQRREVVMLGNPSVQRGQGVLYSQRILLFPDQRNFEMQGQVSGVLP